MSKSPLTLKRINKDFQNFLKNPPKGIALCIPDPQNPFHLLTNITIQDGVYKGVSLHFEINLPDQYPVKPPKMFLLPGQDFDQNFHHHMYKENQGYVMCVDILDQQYISSNQMSSGWSPSYGFIQLLLIIQNFLGDPDFRNMENFEKKIQGQLVTLKKQLKNFKIDHKLPDNQVKTHTWFEPYPQYLNQEDIEEYKKINSLQELSSSENICQDSTKLSDSFQSIQEENFDSSVFKYIDSKYKKEEGKLLLDEFLVKEGLIEKVQNDQFLFNDEQQQQQQQLYQEEEEEEEEKEEQKIDFYEIRQENQQVQDYVAYNYHILQEKIEEINEDQQIEQEQQFIVKQKQDEDALKQQQLQEEARQRLTCYLTGQNLVDNPEIILGYPINLKRVNKMMDITPYTDLLSYEGYMHYTMEHEEKLTNFDNTYFKSSTQQPFNYWLPLYLNKENFDNNYQVFKNSLSVILFGNSYGHQEQDFQPKMIVEVLPNMINYLTVNIVNENNANITINNRTIEAWCQLFKLLQEFTKRDDAVMQQVEHKIDQFMKNDKLRNKENLGNLGEFIILLSISKKARFRKHQILEILLREKFARQILWILKKKSQIVRKENKDFKFPSTKKEMLQFAFDACKISNLLLIYNFEVTHQFYNEEFLQSMDSNYGLVDENITTKFVNKMKRINEKIKSYSDFFRHIRFGGETLYNNIDLQFKMLNNAVGLSNLQGYTKVIPHIFCQNLQLWTRDNWNFVTQGTEAKKLKKESCWRSNVKTDKIQEDNKINQEQLQNSQNTKKKVNFKLRTNKKVPENSWRNEGFKRANK